jgi:hypothetical protein
VRCWIFILTGSCLYGQSATDLLRRNCVPCHNDRQKTSGLSLESREAVLAGGKRGPGQIAAAIRHDGKLKMPPGKKLPAEAIALIEEWLATGASFEGAGLWSLGGLRKPTPASGAHPVDYFIRQRLGEQKLTASPEADAATLVRRLSFDLTGLPPSTADLESYQDDRRPGAWMRLVDRFLASPHFGERWARHWLDQARYADSDGGSRDEPRQVWKYREWVIEAINSNMPFDRFVTEQIAGDLLPEATAEQKVATGFLRHHQIQIEAGTDREQYRVESVFDRVDTVGTVFLGLSVGCARCHDHKFDPIAQRDYYRLFALFNNNDEWDNSKPYYDVKANNLDVIHAPVLDLGNGVKSMVYKERDAPRESFIMLGGDFLNRGESVTGGVPETLFPAATPVRTRLDLARWLTDPRHPLTARVAVNRIWQNYFGHGLVETENDFGTQGSPPSHPELLDWLAGEFIRSGWDGKHIHRLIVTSRAYRQSSRRRPDLEEKDPSNRLLARQSRFRLEGEAIRDASLAASGLLTRKIGGRSVFPPQPANAMAASQLKKSWKVSEGADRYRRGLYTFYYRVTPHPALAVFDQPNATQACTRRNRSNTPLQALTLLNDEAYHEFARALASRILREGPATDAGRIEFAYRVTVGRKPAAGESARLLGFLATEKDELATHPAPALGDPQTAAWMAVARVLLNTDEFLTRE